MIRNHQNNTLVSLNKICEHLFSKISFILGFALHNFFFLFLTTNAGLVGWFKRIKKKT